MRPAGGPLIHSWRDGRSGPTAFLSDYAFLVRGLLALDRATGDGRWLEAAAELTAEQVDRLGDPAGGFFVAEERDDLLFRSKEVFDGAMPGANSVAALNLLELAERTGEARWAAAADGCLRPFAALVDNHPAAVRTMALAADRLRGPAVDRGDLFADAVAPAAGAPDARWSRPACEVEPRARTAGEASRWSSRSTPAGTSTRPRTAGRATRAPAPGGHDARGRRARAASRWTSRAASSAVPVPGEPPLRVYEGRVAIRGELRAAGTPEGRAAGGRLPALRREIELPGSGRLELKRESRRFARPARSGRGPRTVRIATEPGTRLRARRLQRIVRCGRR